MTVEYKTIVKRTIYVSECVCGSKEVLTENPPRERMCSCGQWVPYKEESYEGPELK